jgi:23S rRNA pseudouridine1911/1915/1917 synthase
MSQIDQELIFDGSPGERLDQFLVKAIANLESGYSRSRIQQHIKAGRVVIEGKVETHSSFQLQGGERIALCFPAELPTYSLDPYDVPLQIVYEDDELFVIDKQAGLTMHPGTGNRAQTLVNALVSRFGSDKLLSVGQRCGIVHRLDKDTSGLVVVARTAAAHSLLAAQFAARTTSRTYEGLIISSPRRRQSPFSIEHGTLEGPIGRSKRNPVAMEIREDGRPARTHFTVLEHFDYAMRVAFRLDTGRTHQIRVHTASVQHPLVGDTLYGMDDRLPKPMQEAAKALGRQALHAASLGFDHPVSGERLEFTSEIPEDIQRCIAAFRG